MLFLFCWVFNRMYTAVFLQFWNFWAFAFDLIFLKILIGTYVNIQTRIINFFIFFIKSHFLLLNWIFSWFLITLLIFFVLYMKLNIGFQIICLINIGYSVKTFCLKDLIWFIIPSIFNLLWGSFYKLITYFCSFTSLG